jgi:DNA-binding response OmpR family regulator
MKADEIRQTEDPASAALRCQTDPPHRILVVEDEPCMRLLNARMLLDAGYHVDAAENGAAAWDTLQAENYDLLITDNSMPKVSGVELIEKVRDAGMALPVIMATAVLPKEAFTRQPRLKPAATLLKPYTITEFLGTVRNVLCMTVSPSFYVQDLIQLDELQAITENIATGNPLSKP